MIIDQRKLEDWLLSTNTRYRAKEIPPKQRPFIALQDYSIENKCAVAFGSPTADFIFNWFLNHSAPRAHAIGSMFTGAFYFDAYFWPLHIPIGYGTFSINPINCLETMPEPLKEQLAQNKIELNNLVLYYLDCLDYSYGLDELQNLQEFNPKALAFISNGNKELRGAIAQLLAPNPNSKAILALRMSCEIFLKALLIQEKNLIESDLKKLSHKIKDIANECHKATMIPELKLVAESSSIFPAVSERYDGKERKFSEVWSALCITQIAATAVIRRYSGRDIRAQIISG